MTTAPEQLDPDILSSRIMVVDDTDYNRQLIGHFLNSAGWKNLVFCKDGLEALECYKRQRPDLILLDIAMPGMDGVTVCQTIRQEHKDVRTPILIQTAHIGITERTKAFSAGATDFLSKPLYQSELIARVRIQLENRTLIRQLQTFHDRLEGELSVARQMQHGLLPSPVQLEKLHQDTRLEIASFYKPTNELAGDSWGISRFTDDTYGVFLTDLSGHGVTAAINAFRLHTMINLLGETQSDPGRMMESLNAHLNRDLTAGQFAAMTYAVLDLQASTLRYAMAGMPYGLLHNAETQAMQFLDDSAMPLAITLNTTYKTTEVPFPAGSLLFLYSDAAIETEDDAEQYVEMEAIRDWIAHNQEGVHPAHIIDAFIDNIFGQQRLTRLHDDLTLVCLRSVKA